VYFGLVIALYFGVVTVPAAGGGGVGGPLGPWYSAPCYSSAVTQKQDPMDMQPTFEHQPSLVVAGCPQFGDVCPGEA
jgi:hypothetical protein